MTTNEHTERAEQEARMWQKKYFQLLEHIASLKALEPAPPIIIDAKQAAAPQPAAQDRPNISNSADAIEAGLPPL